MPTTRFQIVGWVSKFPDCVRILFSPDLATCKIVVVLDITRRALRQIPIDDLRYEAARAGRFLDASEVSLAHHRKRSKPR